MQQLGCVLVVSLYGPFITVLILIISMCYNTPHTGFIFCIISCPFRQMIKNRSLKLRIGSIKVMRQASISVPHTKGELHLFCLASLLCRHFEDLVVLEVPRIGTDTSSACRICYGMEHQPSNYEHAMVPWIYVKKRYTLKESRYG